MNVHEGRICRRCLLEESGRADTLLTVRDYIAKIAPSERCDEETYVKRLSVCAACDDLEDGTCLKCGCYPEFRAAFRVQRCPAKKWVSV